MRIPKIMMITALSIVPCFTFSQEKTSPTGDQVEQLIAPEKAPTEQMPTEQMPTEKCQLSKCQLSKCQLSKCQLSKSR